ncbi:MAG: S1C family serine protease [Treponema sp.]|nr:S1C family serine protease [Treponema sp.]
MKKIILLFVITIIIFGCRSIDTGTAGSNAEITPGRTTSSIRLGDIERQVNDNPVMALNLIFIYKETYSVTDNISGNEDWQKLSLFEKQAAENLLAAQEKAIDENRWEDAVSLGRSISSIGLTTPNTGREAAFTLLYAKKKLQEGDNLSAFLAAVRSHEMQPMDFQSALLFLEKAVEARQRRSSAFFFAAAQSARDRNRNIPAALAEYATGSDTFSDMIKGVATVIVDRGFRIERGMGMPDRVLGSAFFVDSSGLLITNYHVIASEVDPKHRGASRMFIRMGDAASPRIPARVIGWDKALDLALIKTEIETDYVFSLVDRVIPQVGDTVLAIGSPMGLQKTVTSGIVSALGRRFLQIGDVIQVDAAVNQGNSGGPLIDSEGRLVGVIFAGMPQFQGLNFAVPAEILAAALPAMIKGGRAQRPWFGLTICETFSGAEVIYTAPNTPAAFHKINEGSFIRTINGRTVTAPQGGIIPALQNEMFTYGPGELVALETSDSEGNIKKSVIMTVSRPDLPLLDAARIDRRERMAAPLFGMVLVPLQSSLFSSNFRVDRVVRGSIADEAGISENDPVSINRLRIMENEGFAILEISVKKRRMGYLDTNMQLPVWLDSPNTL